MAVRYDNVIVGGGLAGRHGRPGVPRAGRRRLRADHRPRAAPALPPAAAHQGVPARREAGSEVLHAPGRVVAGAERRRAQLGTEATALDPARTRVTLAGGETRRVRPARAGDRRDAAHASADAASIRTIDDSGGARAEARRRHRPPGRDRRRLHRRRGGGERAHEGLGRDHGRARERACGSTCSARRWRPTSSASSSPTACKVHTGTKELPDGDYDVKLAGIGVDPNIEPAHEAAGPDRRERRPRRRAPASRRRRLGDRRHRRLPERRPRPADPDRALGRRPEPGRLRRPQLGRQGGRALRRRAVLLLGHRRLDVVRVRRAGQRAASTCAGSMDADDFVAYYLDDADRVTACLGVNRSDDVEAAKALITAHAAAPSA